MSPRYQRVRFRAAPGASTGSTGSTGGGGTDTGAIHITSVSGSFTNGQTITVNGSSMWREDLATASSFWTEATYGSRRMHFDGPHGQYVSSYTGVYPAGWYAPGYPSEAGSGIMSTSQSLTAGGASAEFHSTESNFLGPAGTGQCYNIQSGNAFPPNENWLRVYIKWKQGAGTLWPNNYQKILYDVNDGCYVDVVANNSTAPYNQLIVNYADSTATPAVAANHYVNFLSTGGPIELDRWYCIEWHRKIATQGTSNGIVELYVDGNLRHSGGRTGHASSGSTGGFQTMEIGVINAAMATSNTAWDFYTWYDMILGKSTRVWPACVMEIADSSNYATANKVYQEPLQIGDTQVKFKWSTGNAAGSSLTGSQRWLFITNHSREVSSGHQLV